MNVNPMIQTLNEAGFLDIPSRVIIDPLTSSASIGFMDMHNIDRYIDIFGSRSIGDDRVNPGWMWCNVIYQKIEIDPDFYSRYVYILWDAACEQLETHNGPLKDLSRYTVALLKSENYDGSGAGPIIGGLTRDYLGPTNGFNSQNLEYAQVKTSLIEFANAFRRARQNEILQAFRQG